MGTEFEGRTTQDDLATENERLKRRVAELERRLSIQPKSGLPTHFIMERELDALIARLRASSDPEAARREGFSLLIVQFREGWDSIRKTLKSSVGEWILYQTGVRISGILGPGDLLFHTSETEFVLVLPGKKGEGLLAFMQRLLGALSEPHILAGMNLSVRVSSGTASWPEHGEERSELLHKADIAVGQAVEERKPFVMFRPEFLDRALRKAALQNAIIKGIEASAMERIGEQFFVVYQPKIFASALEGGRLVVERVEAEALIRWRHPEMGLVLPSAFIPLAEETGLILPLGKWLLYQCARRSRAWKEAAGAGVGISVNLSARQFRSGEAADSLASALRDSGADPADLTMELTETSLFEEPEEAAAELRRLSELGSRISMDDFGTGYSSLSHLHRFALDEIKIDRLFIEELDAKREDRVIVQSLVTIARGLGLSLVAEGVESPAALRLLWEMGCRGFQGFLLSRPLSPEGFLDFRARALAEGIDISAEA